ncbi:hypothetical protein QFZ20_002995 [Flavobacterium sp. W4I14]|nr:hypothetical protein [Flavobacterium sp. W4I14]
MKSFIVCLIFLFFSIKSFASDPGANYGCVIQGGPAKLYFSYKTDADPNNWGANFHIYNNNSNNYEIYNDTQGNGYHCGVINSHFGEYYQVGQVCFVDNGVSYTQGDLATFTVNNAAYCGASSLPLDENTMILLGFVGVVGFFSVRRMYSSNIVAESTR